MLPLAQPPRKDEATFNDWMYRLWRKLVQEGQIAWAVVSKTGSNLTDIETRNHADLQNINTASYTHLTATNHTDLTDGGLTTLHQHDFNNVLYPSANFIGTPAHIYTLQSLMDHVWSAGVVDGCELTDNGNGTISIATGVAVIRAVADGHTTLYGVNLSPQLNIALTDDATNYVYLDYTAGVPQFAVSTALTSFNCMDKCIAYMVHRAGNVLHWVDAREQNVDSNRKLRQFLLRQTRFSHDAEGSTLGSSGLSITLTAGAFNFMLQSITHDAFDTSVAGTANVNVFTLWSLAGITWAETANSKVISTLLYNDTATGTVALGNNKFGVSWVYLINDNPSELHVVMGQAEYANISEARVASPPVSVPTLISGLGSLVGFVVYEKGVTVFDNVYSAFTQAFTPGLATTHNGLSGLQGGTINEYYHFTLAQATDLTDAGDSALHYHATDRARSNHTGTQSADTLTDGTTNKVYTATEQTRLANTSGTNTGDQTSVSGNSGTTTAALGLKTSTTTVAIDAATAPTSGQVLTATSTTAATWQTPSSGGTATINNVISTPTTIATDTSYPVVSYLKIDSDLTINGNLLVIG